jgi:hypothetical protein
MGREDSKFSPLRKKTFSGNSEETKGFGIAFFVVVRQQKQRAGQGRNLPAQERCLMQNQYSQRIELFPSKSPHVSSVGLKLDHQTLYIGKLDKAGDGTFISNKRTEDHLFKRLNALGINKELCDRFTFRWIVVPYCGRKLWTSRPFILRHGKTLTFRKAGFEAQLFLPLDEWGIDTARAFESGIGQQPDLFGEVA